MVKSVPGSRITDPPPRPKRERKDIRSVYIDAREAVKAHSDSCIVRQSLVETWRIYRDAANVDHCAHVADRSAKILSVNEAWHEYTRARLLVLGLL